MSKRNLPWAIASAAMLTATLFAGTTGKIAGLVTDAGSGEPLIGVNVIIEGTARGAATSTQGRYSILNIQPGIYDIRTTMIGYTSVVTQGVVVGVDMTTTLDLAMALEVLGGSEVVVLATRPRVARDRTSSDVRISAEQLDAMPVSEIWDVLAIQAGVTKDAGGGIHIRGGRKTEIAYWVDGVSVTDVYDGGLAVAMDNNAIQELQVISGTFNAEYGQAMSGIINMITKDGGSEYDGSLSLYNGEYLSQDDIYRGIDQYSFGSDPDEINFQGSLSGPVPFLGSFATFFTTARYNRNDGHLRALDAFDKYGDFNGVVIFPDDPPEVVAEIEAAGISIVNKTPAGYEYFSYQSFDLAAEVIPFNSREKFNTNSKLTLALGDQLKVRLSLLTSREDYQDYNHDAQMVPDGQLEKHSTGRNVSLGVTYQVSANTFTTLRLAQFRKDFHMELFEQATDTGYIDPNYLFHLETYTPPSYSFNIWGIGMQRFRRRSITEVAKLEFTSQVHPAHQLQFGGEIKRHNLIFDDYQIADSILTDLFFSIKIPDKTVDSFNRDYYEVSPREISLYLQDKIEYETVVINLGLRWDWFDANGQLPTNPAEPYLGNPRNPVIDSLVQARGHDWVAANLDWSPFADTYEDATLIGKTGWWTDTQPVQQISPRIGIAYPITDRGVIHFSFGHFFQIPTFDKLFDSPGYKIPEGSGIFGIFPNPDLKPQQTVMYELGLSQAIGEDWSMDLTGFYRDVRNWVSTGVPVEIGGGASYYTYVNKDYSNVRGFTIDVAKRYSNHFAMNLNYSYQVAEGSNSDPGDEFGAIANGEEPPRSIIPLNWDQTQTVNGTLFLSGNRLGASLISRFGSGYPYTPENVFSRTRGQSVSVALDKNSRRKPITYNFDLKLTYELSLGMAKSTVFLSVYNLLDRRNEDTVFGNTGRANRSLLEPLSDDPAFASTIRPNTISRNFTHPEWYAPPRMIQTGITVRF